MKMKLEHYDYIKSALSVNAEFIPQYREFIIKEGRSKDIEKRLRWDLLHNSVSSLWVCENLYPYLDDTHIDTALRFIMQDFQKQAA